MKAVLGIGVAGDVMTISTEFDLQPDPRILPMLGEINLAQWRCLAELVDNGADGFLSMMRTGTAPVDPEISINLPMKDDASARVTVSDNGPGMEPGRLERAVRAGWSGNNPVDSLGMHFNPNASRTSESQFFLII